MTIFRSKASEVIARGEAERGNFEPTGVPKRMYQYWLAGTQSSHGKAVRKGRRKENFCHFWRVVVVWAPLMFLKQKAEGFVTSKFGAITSVVLLIAAIVTLSVVFQSFAIVVGIIIASILAVASTLCGLFSAISLGAYDSDEERLAASHLTKREALWMMIPGFPVGLPLLAIIKGARAFCNRWGHRANEILVGLFAALIVFVFVSLAVLEGFLYVLLLLGITAAVLFGGGVLAYIASKIADYIVGRRAEQREKDAEAYREMLDSDEPVFFDTTPKSPGRISKFFTGLADFLILTFQIVRVKKWKICPTVEIKV